MGDRANIVMKHTDEQIVFYSHWNGLDGLAEKLKSALSLRERWDDFQYLNRIIFESVIDGSKGTTGFGITTKIWDGADQVINVDVDNKTVRIKGISKSFDEFIR